MSTPTVQAPKTFDEAQAVLAAKLPGYTRRPHQMGLAASIEQAIAGESIALEQAGCGTGKSLAALIPAILSGRRTIVATATKALQGQYRDTDLPFLAKHLGVSFQWAVLKGRSNYPCPVKIKGVAYPTPGQHKAIIKINEAQEAGKVIDRESLPPVADRDWSQLSITSNECPGASSCAIAKAGKCFAERAKDKAAAADIVITNTAYLMQDLQLRLASEDGVQLLGDYGQLIIDEAHNLPESATGALSDTLGLSPFTRLAADLEGFFQMENGDVERATELATAARDLYTALDAVYAEHVLRNRGKADPLPLPLKTIIGELGDPFAALYQAAFDAREEVKSIQVYEDDTKILRARLMRRTGNMTERLYALTTDSPDKTVRWIEQETTPRGDERRILRSAPIQVGSFLNAAIWSKVPAILMSATLANGGDFSYLASQLGLKVDDVITYDAGTPFDYRTQAKLFVPGEEVPAPKNPHMDAWRSYATTATRHLVLEAGGAALLLFTSRSNMENAYRAMASDFRRAGLTVLKQGDAPTGQLIEQFKRGHAVLFGLKTFMEGVDVPGDALRLVVLDKLPFAVPTDILNEARTSSYERAHGPKSSFYGMTIPAMQLVLNQSFGRLIRHAGDKGVVAVLDSRLNTGWGKKIIAKLPPAPTTTDIHEAVSFLKG